MTPSEGAEPSFLSEQTLLDLHEDLLAEHGGPDGYDYNKVCSIAAHPRHKHAYAFSTLGIPDLGACYAFAAAKFHAFTDGNKRVALASLALFLAQNGYTLTSDDDENIEVMRALAAGEIEEEDFFEWVRENCAPDIGGEFAAEGDF